LTDRYAISVHRLKIYNLFARALETGRRTSFSSLFRSECKLILFLTTMYVYCVYPAISKGPKQLPNCLKITETSVVLVVFKEVICDVSAYTGTTQQESGTRKAIFRSVTVYNKTLSSQCNLTADKKM
jgi:hypothetical protein